MTKVTKQQASSTLHRFRLFTRLEQDKDGQEDMDEPGKDFKVNLKTDEDDNKDEDIDNPDEIEIEDSNERYCGYANEVGEAFRAQMAHMSDMTYKGFNAPLHYYHCLFHGRCG